MEAYIYNQSYSEYQLDNDNIDSTNNKLRIKSFVDAGIKCERKRASAIVTVKMFTLIQVLVPVALLSSIAFGLPLAEDNIFDGLAIDVPSDAFHFPLIDSRIFGGQEAAIGQFPHQISLRLRTLTTDFRHICGGSIISNRFVVTAGHCFVERFPNPEMYRIVAGAHLNNGDDGVSYAAQRWIVHEGLHINITQTNTSIRNDIALIQTATTIVFNSLVAPIALHTGFFQGGAPAVTSGWGRTNVSSIQNPFRIYFKHAVGEFSHYSFFNWQDEITNLKFLNMNTLSNPDCRIRFPPVTPQPPPVHDWDTICAFSGKDEHGICSGDSGGPLVAENRLIGLTSWAFGCGSNLPDGFTRISSYIGWIETNAVVA